MESDKCLASIGTDTGTGTGSSDMKAGSVKSRPDGRTECHSSGLGNPHSTPHVGDGIDYTGFEFLGALLDPAVACGIADGILDPVTYVSHVPHPISI